MNSAVTVVETLRKQYQWFSFYLRMRAATFGVSAQGQTLADPLLRGHGWWRFGGRGAHASIDGSLATARRSGVQFSPG